MSNGGLGIIAALAALVLGSKQSSSGTNVSGYQPLVGTNGSSSGSSSGGSTPAAPAGSLPIKDFSEWNNKTGGLTGLTIVNVPAPAENYARATATSTTASPAAPAAPATSNNIGKYAGLTPKAQTGFQWFTPQGVVESREPTQQETDSGIGCPEIPDIWTYPGQSAMDLRYCQNQLCPSNMPYQDVSGEVLAPTPAVLQDQGQDSAPGKRWYCGVCRTYQG